MAAIQVRTAVFQVQGQLKMGHFSLNTSSKSLNSFSWVPEPITLTRMFLLFRTESPGYPVSRMFGDYSSVCTWAEAEEENKGTLPEG